MDAEERKQVYDYLAAQGLVDPQVFEFTAEDQASGLTSLEEKLELEVPVEEHTNYVIFETAQQNVILFLSGEGVAEYVKDQLDSMEDPDTVVNLLKEFTHDFKDLLDHWGVKFVEEGEFPMATAPKTEYVKSRWSSLKHQAAGTGLGAYRRGKVLTEVGDVQPGQLLAHESIIFNAINLVKITQTFLDKFYGIFVSPENPNEKSKSSDEEFVVYPTDLEKGEYYIALEPAPADVGAQSGDASGEGTKPVAPAPVADKGPVKPEGAEEAPAEPAETPEEPAAPAGKGASKTADYDNLKVGDQAEVYNTEDDELVIQGPIEAINLEYPIKTGVVPAYKIAGEWWSEEDYSIRPVYTSEASKKTADRNRFRSESVEELDQMLQGVAIRGADDLTVNMDGEGVIVAIMHDASGYTPGAYVAMEEKGYRGGEDSVLQGASEQLTEILMKERDWADVEKDAQSFNMDPMEYLTEGVDGRVFVVSVAEFKNMVETMDGGKDLTKKSKIEFIPAEGVEASKTIRGDKSLTDTQTIEELRDIVKSDGTTLDADDVIQDLGKFEGEHISTLYFYDAMMNGGGETVQYAEDGVGSTVDVFNITDQEAAMFGVANKYFVLTNTDQGFVSGEFTDTMPEAEEEGIEASKTAGRYTNGFYQEYTDGFEGASAVEGLLHKYDLGIEDVDEPLASQLLNIARTEFLSAEDHAALGASEDQLGKLSAEGSVKQSIKSPVRQQLDYGKTKLEQLAAKLKLSGQDEPASSKEAPDANPTTYGEPTHETPLGHFMDSNVRTTDADRVIDEVLTYIEAEHSPALKVEYEDGTYIVLTKDMKPLAEIWSENDQVQVTALVGDKGQSVAEKASDIVDLVLELKEHKETPEEPSVDNFEIEPEEDEMASEELFGSRMSVISTLLANTETVASAVGGEGDDGSAYDLLDGGRNFTGVDETVASVVVDEYLNGKATSFASLEDFGGFVSDMYDIPAHKVQAGVAEAWAADDRRAIVAFIKTHATTDLMK